MRREERASDSLSLPEQNAGAAAAAAGSPRCAPHSTQPRTHREGPRSALAERERPVFIPPWSARDCQPSPFRQKPREMSAENIIPTLYRPLAPGLFLIILAMKIPVDTWCDFMLTH